MIRLRNKATGVVVQVRDDKAALLGGGWEPVEAPAPAEQPRPRRSRKKSN